MLEKIVPILCSLNDNLKPNLRKYCYKGQLRLQGKIIFWISCWRSDEWYILSKDKLHWFSLASLISLWPKLHKVISVLTNLSGQKNRTTGRKPRNTRDDKNYLLKYKRKAPFCMSSHSLEMCQKQGSLSLKKNKEKCSLHQ